MSTANSNRKRGCGVDRTGRSKGKDQYVPIPYTMARSAPWRSLRGTAIKVYVELRCRYHGSNNGELSLSMDEAARLLGMSKGTAKAAFAELTDKGFIKMTKQGSWYGRQATLYAVTDRSLNGHIATNDWKVWAPPPKTDPRYSHRTVAPPDGSV